MASTLNESGCNALISEIELTTKALTVCVPQTNKSPESQFLQNHGNQRLLAAAQHLISALEAPEVTALKIAKGPVGHAVLRTAFKLDVFGVFTASMTRTTADIALHTGAEHLLVVRMMRTLAGIGIFSEQSEETYTHNALSRTLGHPNFRTLMMGMCETTTIMSKLPDYLDSLDYKNPSDPQNSLFHYAHGTNLNMFEWLQTQPDQLATFSAYMAAATEIQETSLLRTITSFLPVDETNCSEDQNNRILLVDVGGGRGQVLNQIPRQRPNLKGRIIVQDLPNEIEGREPADGVEIMSFDFFAPQSIKGAHVYFFTHIFHNWPSNACRQIIANTLPALTPNFSRIIIVDQVVPNTGASAFTAFMDISMMAFGGMERTERQWRELLESAGLVIIKIENPSPGSLSRDSVIEAMLRT